MALRHQGRIGVGLCVWAALGGLVAAFGQAMGPEASAAPQGELRRGRALLMSKEFGPARQVFARYLRAHPDEVQAELGLGDAQLGLQQFQAAEATYRAVTARQPEQWQAHKNLVVVEAALGRWEEFDRERTVLRLARERGAPGISRRESDVIDSFTVHGQRWVVRSYFQPVGRSEARYNFERFSAAGKVEAYVSLENAVAAKAALQPGDVRIGADPMAGPADRGAEGTLSLNWYTGLSHGQIRVYREGKPAYEQLRADVIRWLRRRLDSDRNAAQR